MGTGGISPTGSGGTSTGGSTGTGGSSSGGAGGLATGSGGANVGGSMGSGGTMGSGGAAAGQSGGDLCTAGDCRSIVGNWDGALDLFPCSSTGSGYDCPNACPSGNGKTTSFTYPISGNTGTIYDVTIEAKGIVEVYPYQNTTFPSTYTNPIKGNGAVNNLFSIGGTQAASGNGNDYNTYELDVSPAVAGLTNVVGSGSTAYNVYYLNAVPANESPHIGGGPTQHLTFSIDDIATIKVPGGATVTFKTFDSNCVEVQNCGVTSGSVCTSPQKLSLAGAVPPAPSSFDIANQPYVTATGHGQFVFFDIKSVTVSQ
ncbi:MAG TPA: hypothetical protein VHH90_10880 [Polyangia bacterium]|nr:hypothetical protein [Polyangia bacterium]